MRLTDLRDKPRCKTLDGETLGRVHEVHCDGGRIVALMCGAGQLHRAPDGARPRAAGSRGNASSRSADGEIVVAPETTA